jgi:hypothetical protein
MLSDRYRLYVVSLLGQWLAINTWNMMLITRTSGIDDGHLKALHKSCLNYGLLHVIPKG